MMPFGLPFYLSPSLRDGQVVMVGDPGGPASPCMIVGTRPLTYVEQTIRDITIDVFGEAFLRQIGAYDATSDEVVALIRGAARKMVPDLDPQAPPKDWTDSPADWHEYVEGYNSVRSPWMSGLSKALGEESNEPFRYCEWKAT